MSAVDTIPKVKLEEFLPEVRLMVPGCPDEIIASYVRQAVIEVADRTLAFKRMVPIELQIGVRSYALEAEDCTRVVAIDWICDYRGRRHFPKPNAPCVMPCATWCNPACSWGSFNPFEGYNWASFKQPNVLELSFMPDCDVATGMAVRLTVAPTRDACDVDRIAYDKYAQDIHVGAAKSLLALQQQAWYQPQMAAKYERDWQRILGKIATDAIVQESRGPFQATAQRFV